MTSTGIASRSRCSYADGGSMGPGADSCSNATRFIARKSSRTGPPILPSRAAGPSNQMRASYRLTASRSSRSSAASIASTSSCPSSASQSGSGAPLIAGAINTRRSTRSGCISAKSIAMRPPWELPTSTAGLAAHASSTACRSSVFANGAFAGGVSPNPRRSYATPEWSEARIAMTSRQHRRSPTPGCRNTRRGSWP